MPALLAGALAPRNALFFENDFNKFPGSARHRVIIAGNRYLPAEAVVSAQAGNRAEHWARPSKNANSIILKFYYFFPILLNTISPAFPVNLKPVPGRRFSISLRSSFVLPASSSFSV